MASGACRPQSSGSVGADEQRVWASRAGVEGGWKTTVAPRSVSVCRQAGLVR